MTSSCLKIAPECCTSGMLSRIRKAVVGGSLAPVAMKGKVATFRSPSFLAERKASQVIGQAEMIEYISVGRRAKS